MSLYDRAFCLSMIFHIIIFQLTSCCRSYAFTVTSQQPGGCIHPIGSTSSLPSALAASLKHDHFEEYGKSDHRRRDLLKAALSPLIGTSVSCFSGAVAEAMTTVAADTVSSVEMKTFIDPQGLFALKIPKSFFAIRRTSKGDLPDATTGAGRRGSSIFNAGDLAKAEVLAIER
jgi:hypothetical protein